MRENFSKISIPDRRIVDSARRALVIEQAGIEAMARALDGPLGVAFTEAVALIMRATGRIILSGIGKSGHIARKIAATLSSTGTPSLYVHPSEASHGDLGMITPQDVLIVISNSGETVELKPMVDYATRFAVPLIAITGKGGSTLALASNVSLVLPEHEEACPIGLAPTTSTTMQIAIGDALAVALLEARGFTADQFKELHPGGKLGAQLTYVGEIMHSGSALPMADADLPMSQALVIMTAKSFGCLGIIDEERRLVGVITDGDLRRHMSAELPNMAAGAIMTRNPVTIPPDMLASTALQVLNAAKITSLFVVEDGRPIGILHIHDLLRIGVK